MFCDVNTVRPSASRSEPETTTPTALLLLGLLLEYLGDLHVNVEELGGAAVEADALALVEVALAVVGRDAFFRT